MALSYPNPGRVFRITINDIVYSVTHLKGLIFLLPFFLFWLWTLSKLQQGAAAWLEQPEGLALAAWLFNPEQAMSLFNQHPPTLSVYLLIGLYTVPVFAILASANQLASDAGRGYFRFLLSRVTRQEIFFGRFLSAFLIVCFGLMVVGIVVTQISLMVDQRPAADIVSYAVHVNFVMLLYALPFVLLMTLLSSVFSSGKACLFTAFLIFVAIKVAGIVIRYQWPEFNIVSYVLPNKMFAWLVDPAVSVQMQAVFALPVYALVYMTLAWFKFNNRNL